MHHGRGEEWWFTNEFEKKRRNALEWRFRYDDETLDDLEITGAQGGGRTYDEKYKVKQSPFPQGTTRTPKDVDIRYHPRVG